MVIGKNDDVKPSASARTTAERPFMMMNLEKKKKNGGKKTKNTFQDFFHAVPTSTFLKLFN